MKDYLGKRKTGLAGFLVGISLCFLTTACNQGSTPDPPEGLDDAAAYHAIYEAQRPVLVLFFAKWAEPSIALIPKVRKIVDEDYAGKIDFILVDSDKAPQTGPIFELNTMPSLVFVSRKCKHGKVLAGMCEQAELEQFIKESYEACQ